MATFSKRHYVATAAAIRKARDLADGMFENTAGPPTAMLYGIGMVEAEIAVMFAADNPLFDGVRFADATGSSPIGGTMRRDIERLRREQTR